MTTLHTPGPWSVEIDHQNNAPEYIRANANGEMYDLASVLCDETGNATANARLIAAAPAMLEALKIAETALEAHNGNESSDLATIRAAIAKAEGKQSVEV